MEREIKALESIYMAILRGDALAYVFDFLPWAVNGCVPVKKEV